MFLYWLGSWWWWIVFIFILMPTYNLSQSQCSLTERWKFIFPPDKNFLSLINNLRAILYINDVPSVWWSYGLNSLYFISLSLSHLLTTTSLGSNLFPHTVFAPQENKPRENLILTGLAGPSPDKTRLRLNKKKLDIKQPTMSKTSLQGHYYFWGEEISYFFSLSPDWHFSLVSLNEDEWSDQNAE